MPRPASRAQIAIGTTTVTYLPDGHGWIYPDVYFDYGVNDDPLLADAWATHPEYLDDEGRLPVSIGSFLIRTEDDSAMLVDLGLGDVEYTLPGAADFKGGALLDGLAAEGLSPNDIDTVVFTHLHHDHVGWASDVAPAPGYPRGRVVSGLTFGNARHLVSEDEWRHWEDHPGFPGPDAHAAQAPLRGHLGFVNDGDEIAPGVRVLATPGHTPGHLSLIVTDPTGRDERRLIVLGDVMHCQVQVSESHWSCRFDLDAEQNSSTREWILKELELPGTMLAAGHFADHVFGRALPPRPRRAWASAISPRPRRDSAAPISPGPRRASAESAARPQEQADR
ncbi:MBL fold metallo-hydrolase [Actinomadura fulvescens]|uniref:MBL fold metallo-hydrolase n=1 Tax=Actinomadura fulvescens TaxID=46160 RepID=A0ABN3QQ35_9ACTN